MEEWQRRQGEIFGHGLPKLPQGWIRVWSRSKQKVYFFNIESKASQFDLPGAEPDMAAPAPELPRSPATPPKDPLSPERMEGFAQICKSMADWHARQNEIFGHLPKLPTRWIR